MNDELRQNEQIFLTPAGAARLDRRIAEARGAYLAVCADNGDAAESGDTSVWHDNFAYEENQRQMHRLARRVRELETVRDRATIVEPGDGAPTEVRLGARVRLRFLDDDTDAVVDIAGWGDGDPAEGRISYTAPVARALIGAKAGETRTIVLTGRTREVEIVALSRGGGR